MANNSYAEEYVLDEKQMQMVVDLIEENETLKEENLLLTELVEVYEVQLEKERELYDDFVIESENYIKSLYEEINYRKEITESLKIENNDLKESLTALSKNHEDTIKSYEENIELLNEQIRDYERLVNSKDTQINDMRVSNWYQNGGFFAAGILLGLLIF